MRKPKISIPTTQKSHGFQEQLAIGRQVAEQLTVVTPLSEAANIMGMSKTMLRRIELQALYKVAMRMRELRASEL